MPQPNKPSSSTSSSSAFLEKTKHGSRAAFDKGWGLFEKLGAPVNKLTNKIGSEAFWPTTLDHESEKCARILRSFCKDGFYKEQPAPENVTAGSTGPLGPKTPPKVLVKIPQKVIKNCVGLAIFTVMRTGMWISGAGGSGVLIAKKEDGSWSPPSGILIHTLGVGFMAGIDIYDCVLVINNREALEAFSKVRVSLGGEISLVAGPVGAGGNIESEILKNRKPVWTYMKSRGLYGGIQFDGTVVVERNDENARFYGERMPISQILAGNVRHVPRELRLLMEVLKDAEGRTDADPAVLSQVSVQQPPSEVDVQDPSHQPTAEQRQDFALPPSYDEQFPASAASGHYAPEKAGYANVLPGSGAPQQYQQGQTSYPSQSAYSSSLRPDGHAYGQGAAPPAMPPRSVSSGQGQIHSSTDASGPYFAPPPPPNK